MGFFRELFRIPSVIPSGIFPGVSSENPKKIQYGISTGTSSRDFLGVFSRIFFILLPVSTGISSGITPEVPFGVLQEVFPEVFRGIPFGTSLGILHQIRLAIPSSIPPGGNSGFPPGISSELPTRNLNLVFFRDSSMYFTKSSCLQNSF